MRLVTTSQVPGENVHAVLGLVHGTAVVAVDAVGDILASVKNFFGGRVGTYEKQFNKARDLALEDLKKHAQELGANAVIGLSVDFEFLSLPKGAILAAIASGTAVLSEPVKPKQPLPI